MKTIVYSRDLSSLCSAPRHIDYRLLYSEDGYGIELEETAPGLRECECRTGLSESRQQALTLLTALYEYGVTLATWQDVLHDLLVIQQEH